LNAGSDVDEEIRRRALKRACALEYKFTDFPQCTMGIANAMMKSVGTPLKMILPLLLLFCAGMMPGAQVPFVCFWRPVILL
jgi:hypothetical protein